MREQRSSLSFLLPLSLFLPGSGRREFLAIFDFKVPRSSPTTSTACWLVSRTRNILFSQVQREIAQTGIILVPLVLDGDKRKSRSAFLFLNFNYIYLISYSMIYRKSAAGCVYHITRATTIRIGDRCCIKTVLYVVAKSEFNVRDIRTIPIYRRSVSSITRTVNRTVGEEERSNSIGECEETTLSFRRWKHVGKRWKTEIADRSWAKFFPLSFSFLVRARFSLPVSLVRGKFVVNLKRTFCHLSRWHLLKWR